MNKTEISTKISRAVGTATLTLKKHSPEILLVGGSTKMPQVTQALVEKYGMEPKILDPDEAVAKGAAIYALGAYEIKVEEIKEKIK